MSLAWSVFATIALFFGYHVSGEVSVAVSGEVDFLLQ
jgi:hypothetical protein